MKKIVFSVTVIVVFVFAFVGGIFTGGYIVPKIQTDKDYEALEQLVLSLNDEYDVYLDLVEQKDNLDDDKGDDYYTKAYNSGELEYYIEDAEFFGYSTEKWEAYSNYVFTENNEEYYAQCTKEEYENYKNLKEQIAEAYQSYLDSNVSVSREVGKYNATHNTTYYLDSSGGYYYLNQGSQSTDK